jgi:hypothetical protein
MREWVDRCVRLTKLLPKIKYASPLFFAIAAAKAAPAIAPGMPETTAPTNAPVVGASSFALCKLYIIARIRRAIVFLTRNARAIPVDVILLYASMPPVAHWKNDC